MKMIRRTRMTSMKGVTLISWFSAKWSSWSSPASVTEAPIALLRRARMRADMGAIQIARQQSSGGPRRAANQFEIVSRHAGKMIVNDDRGDRCDQAECGGQQSFGDTRRNDGEIGGLRLRNTDETVHDAPHGAEQSNER